MFRLEVIFCKYYNADGNFFQEDLKGDFKRNKIEQTITSIEVAEMVGKEHSKLLRDIRNYVEQFNQSKIGFVDFFTESTYKDNKGEIRPCYNVTKKGCEFIAHKLTAFT